MFASLSAASFESRIPSPSGSVMAAALRIETSVPETTSNVLSLTGKHFSPVRPNHGVASSFSPVTVGKANGVDDSSGRKGPQGARVAHSDPHRLDRAAPHSLELNLVLPPRPRSPSPAAPFIGARGVAYAAAAADAIVSARGSSLMMGSSSRGAGSPYSAAGAAPFRGDAPSVASAARPVALDNYTYRRAFDPNNMHSSPSSPLNGTPHPHHLSSQASSYVPPPPSIMSHADVSRLLTAMKREEAAFQERAAQEISAAAAAAVTAPPAAPSMAANLPPQRRRSADVTVGDVSHARHVGSPVLARADPKPNLTPATPAFNANSRRPSSAAVNPSPHLTVPSQVQPGSRRSSAVSVTPTVVSGVSVPTTAPQDGRVDIPRRAVAFCGASDAPLIGTHGAELPAGKGQQRPNVVGSTRAAVAAAAATKAPPPAAASAPVVASASSSHPSPTTTTGSPLWSPSATQRTDRSSMVLSARGHGSTSPTRRIGSPNPPKTVEASHASTAVSSPTIRNGSPRIVLGRGLLDIPTLAPRRATAAAGASTAISAVTPLRSRVDKGGKGPPPGASGASPMPLSRGGPRFPPPPQRDALKRQQCERAVSPNPQPEMRRGVVQRWPTTQTDAKIAAASYAAPTESHSMRLEVEAAERRRRVGKSPSPGGRERSTRNPHATTVEASVRVGDITRTITATTPRPWRGPPRIEAARARLLAALQQQEQQEQPPSRPISPGGAGRHTREVDRCKGFMPLWNRNDYCAVCFGPLSLHHRNPGLIT